MFERIKSLLSQGPRLSGYHIIGFSTGASEWTKQKSLSNYERSLYANKAISIRAQKVGQIQFILEKERSGEPVEWNEWLQLLDKPNPYQSGDQFWALAQKYYDVVGACYILKVKDNVPFPGPKPTELRLLRADLVDVLLSPDGTQVLGFQYTANNTTTIYTTEEVIYHYRPDPRNPLLGESLLASALRAIETEYEISQYQTNVLKNGGRLETVLKVDGITTPETIDRTLKQYQEKYAGAKNAGRPLVLGTDMSLEQQGLTPMELAYADTKLATLNDIVIATGVPKVMLGVGSQETFANADAEIASFLRDRIKPELQSWTTTLNWRLIPDEFHLTFEDPTPEDTERRNATIKVQSDIGALTTNEKREMYGMDPIDGGDAILIPMNMVPLQTEKPTPTPAPAEEKSVKWTHPLKDARVRKMYGKGVDSRARMLEKMFEERVNTFFEGQQERVMTAMGKKRKIHKDLVGDIFNRELEVSLAKTALLAAIREVYVTEGNATAATYNTTFTLNSSVEENIRHRAELLTDSIINTTADQLALRITDNIEVGGNRQDLIASIQELYGDISEGRAGVIARTEVHAGMQDAHAHVYQEAGFPTKIWTTVGDSDVREEHAEMDGEEVPLHGVFSNSEYSPSSPNCRCTI